ncbi:cellulose biosynthesis cyclic di-GMP-binding regulatory protein BcsB [Spongiibacter pelagi]|nr:cellulose biosynthesis cyclic di-GMP-binding regulatory protein BcsB [Spongiibacter pelagi]
MTTEHSKTDTAPRQNYTLDLNKLGHSRSQNLKGSGSQVVLGFGSRLDEIIESAELDLKISTSPALLETLSHLKVYLNDEFMQAIPYRKSEIGQSQNYSIKLDPRYFSSYNQIRIEFIGHLNKECWNPDDPSIWTEISQASTLHLNSRKLKLSNELALLPAPFFDKNDFSAVTLPVVFGEQYDIKAIQAAAVASSYFGSLATWRGSQFPVLIDTLPQQHALVFASNDNRPKFLADLPKVDQPTLQLISHPENPYIKLLLIQGRDSEDLLTAVSALALGNPLLSGSIATIKQITELAPRKPYDAPNWIRTDRPVKLAELISSPSELETIGRLPAPIKVSLRLPPDLFTWQSRGIPLDLNFRYSPTASNLGDSKLNFYLNDQFVQSFKLTSSGQEKEDKLFRIPMLDNRLFKQEGDIRIPAFRVGTQNQLAFEFAFTSNSEGNCMTLPAGQTKASISGDSSLDFRGFPHYMEMPNLHAFVSAAYPFSRMADLSETAIVIRPEASRSEVETLLNIAGHMGASTGYPGVGLTVTDQWNEKQLQNKDILAIQLATDLPNTLYGNRDAALLLDNSLRELKRPRYEKRELFGHWSSSDKRTPVVDISLYADGDIATLSGSQSPLNRKRSTVILQTNAIENFSLISKALLDPSSHGKFFGSVASIRNTDIQSFQVGDTYFVGKLPVFKLIWYHFSNHPLLLVALSLLLIIILAITLWRLLSSMSARRLNLDDED